MKPMSEKKNTLIFAAFLFLVKLIECKFEGEKKNYHQNEEKFIKADKKKIANQ